MNKIEKEVTIKYLKWFESLTPKEREAHMRILGQTIKNIVNT